MFLQKANETNSLNCVSTWSAADRWKRGERPSPALWKQAARVWIVSWQGDLVELRHRPRLCCNLTAPPKSHAASRQRALVTAHPKYCARLDYVPIGNSALFFSPRDKLAGLSAL